MVQLTDSKNTNESRTDLKAGEDTMLARYQRAQVLEQGACTNTMGLNTTLYPHWIADSDSFWYIRETQAGQAYRLVNATEGSNKAAFDHQRLATALNKASGEKVTADTLPLADLDIDLEKNTLHFSAFKQCWRYHQSKGICEPIQGYCPSEWIISPDGRKAVYTRDFNLWLKNLVTGDEKALTLDGERLYAYAGPTTAYGREEMPRVEAIWSPDSTRVFTHVVDTRKVKVGPPIVQHVPSDGSLRPKILRPDRRVAFPEDEHIELSYLLSINVMTGQLQRADCPPSPFLYPPYFGLASGHRGWWASDNQRAYFIHVDRGGKAGRLIEFDTDSGATRAVIEEQSDHAVSFIPITHLSTLLLPLPATDELIWYSQRSGYAHLYLYDLNRRQLKNPITSGDWVLRNVLRFDAQRRELLIQTAGRVKGRNPYYCDICRVNIDTGELIPLISTDHEYVVCDQRSRISQPDIKALGVAPSGNFVVTTRSRVNEVPVSLLLDRAGNERMVLEAADVSALPEGWRWPEPVCVKAADGETDIYGVIYRPSNFSPDKQYPVLDCSYSYLGSLGSFTNNHLGSWNYFSPAAYAELGFIVVTLVNRGNEGLRDKAFNDYQDPTMPLHPLLQARSHKGDCVTGIQQLAERYPYMDIDRVGVVEFGSVPMALTGLLLYPEFYKVGVTQNPQADWRLVGAFGTEAGDYPSFEDFAANLQGKLLLIAGMLEDVKPIAMTFRLVEALRRENKNFDMLLVPNLGHSSTGYEVRRSWDYVVEHLLGEIPPEGFQLTTGLDLVISG